MRSGGQLLASLGLALATLTTGCFAMRPSHGGGQTDFKGRRHLDAADIALPQGYRIELVATGLSFPTDVAFDDENRAYVVESGYCYGEVFTTPRLLRIESASSHTEIARGGEGQENNGPWNGVAFHDGAFYVAEGGVLHGGRILRIGADGAMTRIIEGLPSRGDHHTNGPAIGPDGKIYFAVGVATNSAVVGMDSHKFGWLARNPDFHDIPARDVTLAGINYTTDNPLTPDGDDKATTGAFVPFGTRTTKGQVIPGALPATGALMRMNLDGTGLELVAWGLRNPFGMAFSSDGALYMTDNSYDVRGSRPVFGTGDLLWRIDLENLGTWHGWPDFHGQRPLSDEDHFKAPREKAPGVLLAEHPNKPPPPVAILPVHASANHFDFSRSESFGHMGEAFIANFGDMAPGVGKVIGPVGYNVVRVDVGTGEIEPFAVNRGRSNGPASMLKRSGLERPIAARFDRTGAALYVVDFGIMTMDGKPHPQPGTGVVWRITHKSAGPKPQEAP